MAKGIVTELVYDFAVSAGDRNSSGVGDDIRIIELKGLTGGAVEFVPTVLERVGRLIEVEQIAINDEGGVCRGTAVTKIQRAVIGQIAFGRKRAGTETQVPWVAGEIPQGIGTIFVGEAGVRARKRDLSAVGDNIRAIELQGCRMVAVAGDEEFHGRG